MAMHGVAVVTIAPADTSQASPLNNKAGIGFYEPSGSSFHLLYDTPLSGGASDLAFSFGPANSGEIVPVAGDWDGDGTTSVGFTG